MTALLVVGTLLLLAVRPGVVVNGLQSPTAWAVAAGVLAAGLGVRALLERSGSSRGTAVLVSRGLVLLAVLALVLPSFRQRTLVEDVPAALPAPLRAGAQVAPSAPSGTPAPTAAAPSVPVPSVPVPSVPTSSVPASSVPARTAASPPAARPSVPAAPSAPPAPPAATPAPADRALSGPLRGIGHRASGTVELQPDGNGVLVVFRGVDIEGSVDPSVHLVATGARRPAGGQRLGALKAERGTFSYRLPAGTVPQDVTVLVWCDPYDTPIGAADLT